MTAVVIPAKTGTQRWVPAFAVMTTGVASASIDALVSPLALSERRLSDRNTIMKTKHDWSRFDAMTDEQVHAAALADPDVQRLTAERLARMKPVLRSEIIRRALGLTQEEFAAR